MSPAGEVRQAVKLTGRHALRSYEVAGQYRALVRADGPVASGALPWRVVLVAAVLRAVRAHGDGVTVTDERAPCVAVEAGTWPGVPCTVGARLQVRTGGVAVCAHARLPDPRRAAALVSTDMWPSLRDRYNESPVIGVIAFVIAGAFFALTAWGLLAPIVNALT